MTPGNDSRTGLAILDDMKATYFSKRGTLDAMIALSQPLAAGGTDELPVLSAAPSATEEEKKLVLGE